MPKQPVKRTARFTKTGTNTFLVLSLFVLVVMVVGAGAVFGYGEYLKGVERAKSALLAAAEENINADSVESFVRARDRFAAAGGILDSHLELSNFFDLLESITLTNVRYNSFSFTMLPDGTGEITVSGTARSFNALAAQSAAFSSEKQIKRAIFSGIQVTESGTVSFSMTATLDSRLLEFTVEGGTPPPAAPTTASTTAPRTASSTSAATTTP